MPQYPSLATIANRYRSLAANLAPVKTGALKSAIEAYNRPSGMVKVTDKGISIRLDVSPPGARYGKFWNDPNISWQVKAAKTRNRDKTNFAIKAQNSQELDNLINQYIEGVIVNDFIVDVDKEIEKELRPLISIQ